MLDTTVMCPALSLAFAMLAATIGWLNGTPRNEWESSMGGSKRPTRTMGVPDSAVFAQSACTSLGLVRIFLCGKLDIESKLPPGAAESVQGVGVIALPDLYRTLQV